MKDTKRNEAAAVIAELFGITPRYVRLILADVKRERHIGAKAELIRTAYYKYMRGKEILIKKLSPKKNDA